MKKEIAAELISQSTPEEIASLKDTLIDEIYEGREDPSVIEEEIDAAIQRPSSRIPIEDDKLNAEAWLFATNVGMPTLKLLARQHIVNRHTGDEGDDGN